MALLKGFDVGALKEALDTGAKAAKEALDAGVNATQDALRGGAEAAQQGMAAINIEGIVQGAKDAAMTGKATIEKAIGGHADEPSEAPEAHPFEKLVALLWCLAHADGTVTEAERESLHEIAGSLDEGYERYAADIERDMTARIEEAEREFGSRNAAKAVALNVVGALELDSAEAKLLCWNLLALANSDGLDERELDLIRFVSEKAGVEAAVFEELRNHADALAEVGNACAQLKRSERGFAEIEPLVGEFEKREQAIAEAAWALVHDR